MERNSSYLRILILTLFTANTISLTYIQIDAYVEKQNGTNKQSQPKNFLDCSICGVPQVGKSTVCPIISPGETVKPHNKYPWQAALFDTKVKMKACGAAIISEQYILTAAHCLLNERVVNKTGPNNCQDQLQKRIPCYRNPADFRVKLFTKKCNAFVRKRIDKIIPHPEFDPKKDPIYDICILKLQRPIRCNQFRLPICLPSATYEFSPESEYTFLGWGAKSPNILWSKQLKQMSLKIISAQECVEKIYETKDHRFESHDYDFIACMIGLKNSTPCEGDSGGVVFGPIGKEMYAVSIQSSHVSPHCDPKEPVFTVSIAGHVEWIRKVTGL